MQGMVGFRNSPLGCFLRAKTIFSALGRGVVVGGSGGWVGDASRHESACGSEKNINTLFAHSASVSMIARV